MKKRKKTRLMSLSLAAAMGVSLLAGCGFGASSSTSTGDVEQDESDKTLNVLVWDGDTTESTVSDFEKKYDCKVNLTYIQDTNQILSKMLAGDTDYDLIDLESGYIKTFVDQGLLAELDYDEIPNKENIDPTYLEKGAIGDEDYKYTLPLSAPIFTLITYNKETCPVQINSFADLADEKLKGQICSVNTTMSLYGGALKALGYSIQSTDDKELQ